jgi:ethanolamine utilization protein EutN
MIIGTVTGEVYSTINHPFYDGKKMLIVEKTAVDGKPSGDYLIAIDSVGAGVGQEVLVLDEGTGARQVVNSTTAPVRSIIVGIIDEVTRAQ